MIYGTAPEGTFTEDYNECIKVVKDFVKTLNATQKAETDFTDFWLAARLAPAFQTFLDAGFQKGMANATKWFSEISQNQLFIA